MNFNGEDNRFDCGTQELLREEGQALVEYALILALVSLVAFGVSPMGSWLVARFSELSAAL
jgi:Flp pilus assembly pilin Flp